MLGTFLDMAVMRPLVSGPGWRSMVYPEIRGAWLWCIYRGSLEGG